MLDHFGFYCRNADVLIPFYRACLAPLDIKVVQEQPEYRAAIFAREGSSIFWWLGEGSAEWVAQAGRSRFHFGFVARSQAEVDGFHKAALAAGGKDNGAPGYRRPNCYAAFIVDPEGNTTEAVWRPS